MGMGVAPGMVIPVSRGTIKKVVEKEFLALEEALKKADSSIDQLAQALQMEDIGVCLNNDNIDPEELEELVHRVYDSFKAETGLSLELIYIDPDDGDRYDDISGSVFTVEYRAVFEKTAEAKKFENRFNENLDIAFFTQFG